MGQTLGNTFGKSSKDATNDLNAAGDVVATGTGVKTVSDPNRGLDSSQIRNRKLLGVGGKALSGFSDPIQSPMSGGATDFTFANNQPKVSPPIQDPYNPVTPKNRNPFFGGGY